MIRSNIKETGKSNNIRNNYERKRRNFDDLARNNSEEDEDKDDEIEEEEDIFKPQVKLSKNRKIVVNSLKNVRMLKNKFKEKEKENTNPFLTDEQIDFATKITSKITKEETDKDNTGSLPNENCYQTESSISFAIKSTRSGFNHDLMELIGNVNGCLYEVQENTDEKTSLRIVIEKNKLEKVDFTVNFYKNEESCDYLEYVPNSVSMKLNKEDEIFYDELEVHKEDFPKIIRKFLNYKYSEKFN